MNTRDESRQQWGTKMGFIVSAVCSAIGLGNIWRYPYVLYANGGGTFLIPYFVAIFTAAIPLLILEYVIGNRYRGAPPLAMARINRRFEWIGWLPVFIAGFIVVYYSSILSWALNYFVFSLEKSWGSDPAAFFTAQFLKASGDPLRLGGVNMSILVGLIVIWGSAFYVCSQRIDKGIEAINRVLLPVMLVTMFIIVIRGVTLPNSQAGLNSLFTPDWSKLFEAKVWLAAYGQVFFSTMLATGIMITYASYLPRKAEIVNTAFVAALANSAFEFTAAIGIFGILGYMAATAGTPVTEVVSSGVGLAFVVFPAAINMMGAFGSVIGIVFFTCLTFSGFTSFISLLEAFNAPFIEKIGMSRRKMYAVSCGGGFGVSTLFATGAGSHVLEILDFFMNNIGQISVGILEAAAIAWIAGLGTFRRTANENSYFKTGSWWELCIRGLIPGVLAVSLGFTVYGVISSGYGGYSRAAVGLYGVVAIALCFGLSFIMPRVKWSTPVELNEEE